MDSIVDLLEQKNHFLEKFYTLNEVEIQKMVHGDFSNMERFYQDRESILEIISYIDAKIDGIQKSSKDEIDFVHLKEEVGTSLKIKNEYVHRILNQDLEILSYIEIAKSNIIKELGELKKNKKGVKGYKTPTFNKRLDEEI